MDLTGLHNVRATFPPSGRACVFQVCLQSAAVLPLLHRYHCRNFVIKSTIRSFVRLRISEQQWYRNNKFVLRSRYKPPADRLGAWQGQTSPHTLVQRYCTHLFLCPVRVWFQTQLSPINTSLMSAVLGYVYCVVFMTGRIALALELCILPTKLSSLGLNPDPAINCHPGVSQAGWFINVCTVHPMDVK